MNRQALQATAIRDLFRALFSAAAGGIGLGIFVSEHLHGSVRTSWIAAGIAAAWIGWAAECALWRGSSDGGEGRLRLRVGLAWLPLALLAALPLARFVHVPPAYAPDRSAAFLDALVLRSASGVLLCLALAGFLGLRAAWFGARWGEGMRRPGRWVFLGAAAYLVLFGAMTVLACRAFHKYADLGGANEVVWRIAHGQGTVITLHESIGLKTSYLGYHFALIWFLIAPLYRLLPSPHTLLLLQTALVAAAAFPLYRVCAARVGQRAGAVLALAFLLYPTTQYATLHEVHELIWALPFTLWTFLAVERGRGGGAVVPALLALCCREEVSLVLAGMGVAFLLTPARRKAGTVLVAAGLAWFVMTVGVVMPAIAEDPNWRAGKYAYLGARMVDWPATILGHPGLILEHLLTAAKIGNLALFLSPLGLLPLLGGRSLWAALPLFVVVFLSDGTDYSFLMFYTLPGIPFLFVAIAEGLARFGPAARRGALGMLAGGTLAAAVALGPSPAGLAFWREDYLLGDFSEPYHHRSMYLFTPHERLGHEILSRIPDGSSVSAQMGFLPFLARMRHQWLFPFRKGADWVVVDVRHRNRYGMRRSGQYDREIAALRSDPGLACVADEDGYLLFRRVP